MMIAAVIASYMVICGLIGLVAYLTARSGIRRSQALVDQQIAQMQEKYGHTPPLEPYVREPLPEPPPPPELRITIIRHPESDGDRLPKMAAEMIREVSRLEVSYGGDGLEYDPAGSIEEPTRLVLRLVPRRMDWDATDRLAAVADQLKNGFARRPIDDEVEKQDIDIRAKIDRELQPHLPPAMIENVQVATT